ncbi:SNF2 family N-terminal domain-containing protein [Echria macrotheca]|uniref:SNF2 family N-terminal domain-containing protein n=1 Tax=Echria macrotheca TaxID=438768 RepID=A0AAJ0BHE9_9PEZI|nr:SNF2 family N-terminal domain-containing protein [Echria macrotheca]
MIVEVRDLPGATLDKFKERHSEFGHHAGDTLDIIYQGARVKNERRDSDIGNIPRRHSEASDPEFEADISQLSDGEEPRTSGRHSKPHTSNAVSPLISAPSVEPGSGAGKESPTSAQKLKLEAGQPAKPIRAPRALNAREYWAGVYGKNQKAFPSLNKRKRNRVGAGGAGRTKRRKGENSEVIKSMRKADPLKALEMLNPDLPSPGAVVLSTKASLFKSLEAIRTVQASDANPLARDHKAALRRAVESFGFSKCKLVPVTITKDSGEERWELKNFKSALFNHQVVGASWMVSRELSPYGPHGGILADGMGLGKTVEILACITANPPMSEDEPKTTLIVVPAASLDQWKREIEKHSHYEVDLTYTKASAKLMRYEFWRNAKIVLVTYDEVAAAYPSKKVLARIKGMNTDLSNKEWEDECGEALGDLFRVQYYRVVLDEAHVIKNRDSLTSKACCHLSSMYRWVVSGTPLHNCLEEMYPYLKFLGVDPNMEWQQFKQMFGNAYLDKQRNHLERLQLIADGIMISSRKAGDLFLDRPIVNIPDTAVERDELVNLSREEEIAYRHLEERFRNEINRALQKSESEARKFGYFAFTHYLRQIAAHAFLGDRLFQIHYTREDFDSMNEQLEGIDSTTARMLKAQFAEYADTATPRHQSGDRILLSCSMCEEYPMEPQISDCEHIFCLECFKEGQASRGSSRGAVQFPCPICGKSVRRVVDYRERAASLDRYETRSSVFSHGQQTQAGGSRAQKAHKRHRYGADINEVLIKSQRENVILNRCDEEHLMHGTDGHGVGGSAKLDKTMELILEWQKEAPEDKIIVYTQWVQFGMILGRKLYESKIGFLYNFGCMSIAQRNKAVNDFEKKNEAKVFITGFRCGSVALNLTCANRAIQVDLWWNKALEDQANARIYRIGQTKHTYLVRLVTIGTVDERLIDLQALKTTQVDKIMKGDELRPKILSANQIVGLFGTVETVDGKLVVQDDYERRVEARRRG